MFDCGTYTNLISASSIFYLPLLARRCRSGSLSTRSARRASLVHTGIRGTPKKIRSDVVRVTVGTAAAVLASATVGLITPTPGQAKVEFAAQTSLPCGQCDVNPAGDGKLKSVGQKFKAGGFKLMK